MSRETSFVAVERRDTPSQGDVQLRKVPIALTSGWGGLQTHAALRRPQLGDGGFPGASPGAPNRVAARLHLRLTSEAVVPTAAAGRSRMFSRRCEGASVLPTPTAGARDGANGTAPLKPRDPAQWSDAPAGMHALILLQAADGSWELTEQLACIFGRDLDDLGRGRRDRFVRRRRARVGHRVGARLASAECRSCRKRVASAGREGEQVHRQHPRSAVRRIDMDRRRAGFPGL